MFYLLGSLLFAVAMMAAFAVMSTMFAQYHRAMMAALRTLNMDGLAVPARPARASGPVRLPAGMAARTRQAVA